MYLWIRDSVRSSSEYPSEDILALVRLTRNRTDLEEALAMKRLHELDAMEQVQVLDAPAAYRQTRQALIVARAVRETVLAKRRIMVQLNQEAELRLKISDHMMNAVHERLKTADQQLGSLLYQMNTHGLRSTSPRLSLADRTCRTSQQCTYGSPCSSSCGRSSDSAGCGIRSGRSSSSGYSGISDFS